ncbi:leucine-rich repeat-containing protein 34-like [Chrysoperla carnea]|uniref:leucine-rich repeat-containing protein 34-like n=1 Tax=Chrysoperla carnea TaxID=189513 RepID=UPI001D08B4C2|nr:leucine-rich repeat-containing protein 34-like [Chrysoperla carnea]
MQLYTEKNSDGTKYLRLKGNELRDIIKRRLEDYDVPIICEYIKTTPTIVKLDLAYNSIGDKGFIEIVYRVLNKLHNLQYLNVMHNDITEKGIQAIATLGQNLKLKTLRLVGNKIGSEGGKLIGLLLATNPILEHLDLAETDQTLSSLAFITTSLREDRGFNKNIKVLDISRIIPSFIRSQYQSGHLAETIGDMLKFNTTLVELHLQKCELDGHDIELMLIGMKHNITLKFLDLGYNRFSNMGMELLANYLPSSGLIALNIAGNSIGNIGARALSAALPFTKIRLLDISSNRIQQKGVHVILNSIRKPHKLKFFSLWGNEMTDLTNETLYRIYNENIIDPKYCDVHVYIVDGKYYAARNTHCLYKHQFYCELDYGFAQPKR